MKQIFSEKFANFANIADTALYVSEVKQKAFVEVNEEGTEASALSIIGMLAGRVSSRAPEPVRFFANRPFLFLIREKSTGLILFIGRIDEPR